MNLRDIAIKPARGSAQNGQSEHLSGATPSAVGGIYRMFHLRSSFEAKLDERAIGYLTEGLTSGNWDSLPEQRAMFDALSSAGFIDRSSAPALDIRDSTPLLEVEVEVTNACDLRCRHCFVSHSTDYFPLELF